MKYSETRNPPKTDFHMRGDLELAEDADTLQVSITPSEGKKCGRCWLVLPTVGEHPVHPSLCTRCAEIVAEVY